MKAIMLSLRELLCEESKVPSCWNPKPAVLPVWLLNQSPVRL